MSEHVILFAGPMGAGKTTAVRTLSEVPVVSTEAANSERHVVDKATTTVALDYGEITVGNEDKVRLYGMPGQERFDFMWTILAERAKGLVLLVNNDEPDPVNTALAFLERFDELCSRGGVVIGITRTDVAAAPGVEAYLDAIALARPGLMIPVFTVDPRDIGTMTTLLITLIANLEMRASLEIA